LLQVQALLKALLTLRLITFISFEKNMPIRRQINSAVPLEPLETRAHICKIEWRQPAGTTAGKRPHPKPRKIHHVDVPAGLRRLRAAPSRTSPISTMRSRDRAFAQFAAHNHPTRRDFISAEQAGTSCLRIYPAVTDPGIKPISSVGHGWRPDPPCLRQVSCRMTIFACWMPVS
jgi:hypothetical protein